MSNTNRILAMRWMNEVWNERRDDTVDELLAPDGVGHMEGVGEVRGPAAFRAVRDGLLAAFPDLQIAVDDTVADGDNVVIRWHVTATHGGPGLGIAATQRPVTFSGLTWLRFTQGQIVEGWDAWDQGGVVQRLQAPLR